MSDAALIAELERQREFARQCFAYYDRRQETGEMSEMPEPDIAEVIRPVTAALGNHPVFRAGRNIFFAHKQLNLHPTYAPWGLLRVMLNSDAPSAVAWLHRLFQIDHADLRMVAAMHGLEVQTRQRLVNGVHLMPLDAAPDSPNMRTFARQYRGDRWSMTDVAAVLPPAIAIIEMGTVAASADLSDGREKHDLAYTAMLDTARALTLADGAAPVVGISWTDFVDDSLAMAQFGYMWTTARFEGSISNFSWLKLDDEVLAWAERYLGMAEQLRSWVGLALDRLNLARRRRSPGDQAIDSGICLEALLGDESPQELSYKLRIRAALLLGKTLAERRDIQRAVGKLYSLRSKVVHGRARRAQDALADGQCAKRGLEICSQAVRAIVEGNARPDFATWELTGGANGIDGA